MTRRPSSGRNRRDGRSQKPVSSSQTSAWPVTREWDDSLDLEVIEKLGGEDKLRAEAKAWAARRKAK